MTTARKIGGAGFAAWVLVASVAWTQVNPATAAPAVNDTPGAATAAIAAVPEGVEVVRDRIYVPGGGTRNALDIYRPRARAGKLPVVVWIHGGGWAAGDKWPPGQASAPLAGRGFAVVKVNYRYSSAAPFPAQIVDVKAAIRWVRAHAAEYDLDPERIAVWGHSAGGHLAALAALASAKPAWDQGPQREFSSAVRAVVCMAGPADLVALLERREQAGRGFSARSLHSLLGGSLAEKRALAIEASPTAHVTRGAPPALLIYAKGDPVVPLDQGIRLSRAFKGVGARVELVVLDESSHTGPLFWDRTNLDRVAAFLRRHLAAPR